MTSFIKNISLLICCLVTACSMSQTLADERCNSLALTIINNTPLTLEMKGIEMRNGHHNGTQGNINLLRRGESANATFTGRVSNIGVNFSYYYEQEDRDIKFNITQDACFGAGGGISMTQPKGFLTKEITAVLNIQQHAEYPNKGGKATITIEAIKPPGQLK